VISAVVAWVISRLVLREGVARELLSEALLIQASEDAWILEGHDEQNLSAKLTEHPNLKEEPGSGKFWLRRVELRAILDKAEWNSPTKEPYGFVRAKRAWIVRNEIRKDPKVAPTHKHYPALISSKGREELCGWIERVQYAYHRAFVLRALSKRGLEILRPLLVAVAGQDRIEILRGGLSDDVVRFLTQIRGRIWKGGR
jgi:hypothetical protein